MYTENRARSASVMMRMCSLRSIDICWSYFNMQAKFWNGKMKTVGVEGTELSNLPLSW